MAPEGEPTIPADDPFLNALRTGLAECRVPSTARLLIALSGGADSTALLLGLMQLCAAGRQLAGTTIEAAHFNHALRGERSSEDERFCEELCEELGIRLHTGHAPAFNSTGAGHTSSSEASARQRRYEFLAKVASETVAEGILTGHTMEDQAETVLLALTRGAGLRGGAGMAWRTRLHGEAGEYTVLRPMLGIRRSATEAFCSAAGVLPRQDESNTDISYARNRVRQNVLPELSRVNPGAVEAIARFASIMRKDIDLIDGLAGRALEETTGDEHGGLRREDLLRLEPAVLLHVLAAAYRRIAGTGIDLDMGALTRVFDALHSLDSGRIELPNGITFVLERRSARFLRGDEDPACPYPARVGRHRLSPGSPVYFEGGGTLSVREVSPSTDPASLGRWEGIISPAAAGREGAFQVRSRATGDRFQPLGMASETKLQDFFVNRGVPARWRDRVPLVVGADGICWVAGERVAEWARVPERAGVALLLRYEPSQDDR